MKNKITDKQYRDLEDLSNVQPPAFIWDNIDKELTSKNRKWIWWFSLSSFVLVVSILLFANSKQDYTTRLNRQNITSKTKKSETLNKHNLVDFDRTAAQMSERPVNELAESKRAKLIPSLQSNSNTLDVDQTTELGILPNAPIALKLNEKFTQTETSEASIFKSDSSTNAIKTKVIEHKLLTKRHIQFDVNNAQVLSVINNHQTTSSFSTPKLRRLSSFIEFGLVVGHHNQNFGNKSGLTLLREGTETEWYNWGGYAKYGVQLKPGWSISAGLQQIQHKDLFSYTKENAIRINVISNPDTGLPLDSSLVTGTYISEGEINYTNTDFTMSTAFTKNFKRLNIGCELTGIYNINTIISGKSLNQTGTETRLENENSLYKKNLGLGYQFTGVIQYKGNHNINYNLKPFYKSYLNNWNNETSIETFNINSYGLQFGLTYYLQ